MLIKCMLLCSFACCTAGSVTIVRPRSQLEILPALWIRVVALRVDDAREHLFELDRHQHAGLGIAFNVDQLDVSMTCRGDRLMLSARKRNQSVGFIDGVRRIVDVIKCFLRKGCCCLQAREKEEKLWSISMKRAVNVQTVTFCR